MSYTPTNWSSGDTITAEKLNKIEGGIESSELFLFNVNYSDSGYSINVEYEDVLDAVKSGKRVFAVADIEEYGIPFNVFVPFTCLYINGIDSSMMFSCTSYEGYVGVLLTASGNVFFGHEPIHNFYDVILTPTSADYSGTMDKTPQEIDTAVRGDKTIRFYIPSMGAKVVASQYLFNDDVSGYVAAANITYNPGTGWVMITVVTDTQSSTYSTNISPLTPMS